MLRDFRLANGGLGTPKLGVGLTPGHQQVKKTEPLLLLLVKTPKSIVLKANLLPLTDNLEPAYSFHMHSQSGCQLSVGPVGRRWHGYCTTSRIDTNCR